MYADSKPEIITSNVEEHLLRTLAAVPPTNALLDVECGDGECALALARLGFSIYACDSDKGNVDRTRDRLATVLGSDAIERVFVRDLTLRPFPDDAFGWVVLMDASGDHFAEAGLLSALRRATAPGGWLYVAVRVDTNHVSRSVTQMTEAASETSWAPAQGLLVHRGQRGDWLQSIYRRVEEGTPP